MDRWKGEKRERVDVISVHSVGRLEHSLVNQDSTKIIEDTKSLLVEVKFKFLHRPVIAQYTHLGWTASWNYPSHTQC